MAEAVTGIELATETMVEAGRVAYFHFRHAIEGDVLFRDLTEEEQTDLVERIFRAMQTARPTPDLGEDERLVERLRLAAKPSFPSRPKESTLIEKRQLRTLLDRITSLRVDRERMREALTALDRIVQECIIEKDGPDRVRWEGVWYDGPLATAYLKTLRSIQKLARFALSGITAKPERASGSPSTEPTTGESE